MISNREIFVRTGKKKTLVLTQESPRRHVGWVRQRAWSWRGISGEVQSDQSILRRVSCQKPEHVLFTEIMTCVKLGLLIRTCTSALSMIQTTRMLDLNRIRSTDDPHQWWLLRCHGMAQSEDGRGARESPLRPYKVGTLEFPSSPTHRLVRVCFHMLSSSNSFASTEKVLVLAHLYSAGFSV